MLLASAACSGTPGRGGAPAPAVADTPGSLLQQITSRVGDAACDSGAQCRTLALGSRACGGPERYVAWSTARDDGAELARLAGQYAAARRAEDARSDMMSTCELVTDPGATCRQQRCVLLPRGPGSGGAPVR